MIGPSVRAEHYRSASERFLQSSLENFLARECPKLFGPILRRKMAQAILTLVQQQLPAKDHLQPGQCVWNAISRFTRPDSPNRRIVPVILTLVAPEDIAAYVRGEPIPAIRLRAIRRMLREAFQQEGLLSMRDLGLLIWQDHSRVSWFRKLLESQTGETMPHPGSLQDFGSCISHKVSIVTRVVYAHQSPLDVARETKHSQKAVDRYVADFHRVCTCYRHRPEIDFIHQVTGMSKRLIQQYIDIITANEKGA